MKQRTIAIFGGDARQAYAVRAFLRHGWAVRQHKVPCIPGVERGEVFDSLAHAMEGAEIVLGPVPYKDFPVEELLSDLNPGQVFIAGMLPEELPQSLNKAGVAWHDLLEREDFSILNAISTAEGAIAEAIIASGGTLHLCPVLVLGYGRCAKPLVKKLQGLQAHVTVAARRWEHACAAIADGCEVIDFTMLPYQLTQFGYIFNTVPAVILDEAMLKPLSPEATIIDLASAPGGLDYKAAQALGLNVKFCPGLPGKYAPASAGESIVQVTRIILEEQEGSACAWNKRASASA
jgi:dipicolinate synthase subunit A